MLHTRTRFNLSIISVLVRAHLDSKGIKPTQFTNPIASRSSILFGTKSNWNPWNCGFPVLFPYSTSSSFKISISSSGVADNDEDGDSEEGGDGVVESGQLRFADGCIAHDVEIIEGIIQECGINRGDLRSRLEQCGIAASSELVAEVLSRFRNDWEAAFTFFLWAGKQLGYSHSLPEYHSMIFILGKMRKFDTAWSLIDEMRGDGTSPSLVTPHTLMIMIRRYCAVRDVGKAISSFYAHKMFNFDIRIEEFHNLLSALCRYKNVQDAEHLLLCNESVFPFNTKSFNIILNGWCNVIMSPSEGERVWKEMAERGIQLDVVSYASMMSCYSKFSSPYKVLNLYKQMEDMKIAPDRKVYNAVIHALAKGRRVKEAISLMKTMEENGIAPNIATYSSIIKPLFKAQEIDEARRIFYEMLNRGLSPVLRTYHAFLRILRTEEEVFMLLEKMKNLGYHPNSDTYTMLIRKFCRWRRIDSVFKLWSAMSENGIKPDRSLYTVLIHGLILNGKLEEAHKYYIEMKGKHILPETAGKIMNSGLVINSQSAR